MILIFEHISALIKSFTEVYPFAPTDGKVSLVEVMVWFKVRNK